MKTGSIKKEDTLSPNVQAQRWEQLARPMPLGASEVTSADIRCSALFGSVGLGSYSEFESFFMEAASGPGYGEETCSDLKWILPIFYYKLCSRAEEVEQQNNHKSTLIPLFECAKNFSDSHRPSHKLLDRFPSSFLSSLDKYVDNSPQGQMKTPPAAQDSGGIKTE